MEIINTRTLEKKLSQVNCPVHGKPTEVLISKKLNGFTITANTCCLKQEKAINNMLNKILDIELQKSLDRLF